MKITSLLIGMTLSFSLLSTLPLQAQDYYAFALNEGASVQHYPINSTFTVLDQEGDSIELGNDFPVNLSGSYKVIIDVPWSTKNDILNTSTALLISVQPNYRSAGFEESSREQSYSDYTNKPYLVKKMITPSDSLSNLFNLKAYFSNDLTFSYKDGRITAIQNGVEKEIVGNYFIQTSEGLVKLSFDSADGEFWYVFE